MILLLLYGLQLLRLLDCPLLLLAHLAVLYDLVLAALQLLHPLFGNLVLSLERLDASL